MLPTRDSQRRLQSDILRPWNDLENQRFEKIHDSSYYRIDKHFPLPICSAKLDPKHDGFYKGFLNDKYLSLSLGSESYKFKMRNANEDAIFKNEDDMYKLDTQIENFRKCLDILNAEIARYQDLSSSQQKDYQFPWNKFRPLMYYWEK